MEREEPWEHTFNFSIVLQPALLLFIEWCTSDVSQLDPGFHEISTCIIICNSLRGVYMSSRLTVD